MFFIKRSKIVVDCFTHSLNAYDLFPIAKATEYYPDWWKATPNSHLVDNLFHKATIKSCSGLIEYYKSGYTLPLWTDINFDIDNGVYRWVPADGETKIDIHPIHEIDKYIKSTEYGHVKINSPWAFKSKSDINWLYSDLYWNHSPIENYSLPPGVVNYKYQHTTHINLFLPLKENKRFCLTAGNPMVYLLPLSEKEIYFDDNKSNENIEWILINE